MLEALARNNADGFPFPDLLEKYFPTVEDQDPDYDEDNIPEDEDE